MKPFKSYKETIKFLILPILLLSFLSKADNLIITPEFANFGEVEIGKNKRIIFNIKNPTDKWLKIDGMETSNPINFQIKEWGGSKPCKGNRWLKPNTECTIAVDFIPYKEEKYKEKLKIIVRNRENIEVKLTGKGIKNPNANPRLVVKAVKMNKYNMEEYNFGKVFAGDRVVEVFLLSKRGNGNLVFTKPIRISDSDNFEVNPFGGNKPCNSYQPVLNSKRKFCTIEVYFYPTKEKKYSTDLKLNTNDIKDNEIKIKLYGKGTYNPEPDIEIVKGMENFHDKEIGKQSKFQISIYNYGNYYLEINEIKLKKDYDGVFQVDPNAGTKPCKTYTPILEPHDYCTVYVRFIPKEEKKYETQLVIKSNDPDDEKIKITLKGKGLKKKDIMDLSLKDEITNGCSMTVYGSLPVYLFVPLLLLVRRLKNKFRKQSY
jgi:hypothetical protein